MSHLGRVLRKQKRETRRLAKSPIISLKGLGQSEIVVVGCYESKACEKFGQLLQSDIDSGKYKDIKDFDSYHTPDIEFSHVYRGRFTKKYQNETKKQLVNLGKSWREEINRRFQQSKVTIVVYFDHDSATWFLDSYNWNIQSEWNKNSSPVEWL